MHTVADVRRPSEMTGVRALRSYRLRNGPVTTTPPAPVPEAIEIEIDDRGGVERQDLAQHQSADDGDAERLAKLAALAHADDQRHRAEQ
jgi:hypothetical protein